MKYFAFVLLIFPLLSFSKEHKIERFYFENHSYLCFDDSSVIHDPHCYHCATNPKVIFQHPSPDIEDKSQLPFIMMPLDVSPFHKTYFPGLYYWLDD